MRVPEEVTNLDLILNCDGLPPPVIAVPGDITAEATSEAGAVVSYTATAVDSADGPVPVTCAPPSGSTFPLGTTAVLCSATNTAGNSESATFSVTVADTTPPALALPAPLVAFATTGAGSVVSYTASASDLVDGAIVPACSPVSGSLFPVGTTPVVCVAADAEGNAASGSFPVSVVYDTLAALPPINPDGSSVFKKGQAIPVKFTLTGASAGITDATARLFVAQVTGGVVGPEIPATSVGQSNSGNLFDFSAADGIYIYRLSTDGLAPGLYRLRIDLGDGVLRTILITLKQK